MNISELLKWYQKGIETIKTELEAYPDENKIWATSGEIKNSGGNLCLHIIGNLNHFIGATLGKTGYIRDREAEFSLRGMSRSNLLQQLDTTAVMMEQVMSNLSPADLEANFPFDFAGKGSTFQYLLYFHGHMQYHLGQINYHRRMIG